MTVTVNGRAQPVAPGETVESLLESLGLGAKYALVERNGEPVERERYGDTALADGDALVVARPVAVDSRLYLITAARPDVAELVEAAVSGGVDIVQIRERELPDGELLRVLQEVRALTRRLDVPLVVNDRPDLAVLVEADFVHVGQNDLPVEAVRRFGLLVGQSTHAPAELDATAADYAGVGPVYETPTKAGRPAAGLEYVRYAAGHARLPWFAIGNRRVERGRRRRRRSGANRRRQGDHGRTGPRACSRFAARGLAELIARMIRPFGVPGSSIGRASGC